MSQAELNKAAELLEKQDKQTDESLKVCKEMLKHISRLENLVEEQHALIDRQNVEIERMLKRRQLEDSNENRREAEHRRGRSGSAHRRQEETAQRSAEETTRRAKTPMHMDVMIGVYEEDLTDQERLDIQRKMTLEFNSLNGRLKKKGLPIVVATHHQCVTIRTEGDD